MSSFKVYRGDESKIGDAEAEFQGTQIVAERFNALYPPGGFPSDPQDEEKRRFYRKLMYDIIVDPNDKHDDCVVTYLDHDEVVVRAFMENGSRIFEYEYPTGTKKRLQLVAMQDDPAKKKIHMIIPFGNVDLDSTYLQNAVEHLKDVNHQDPEKRKFLLGLLLLKKCR